MPEGFWKRLDTTNKSKTKIVHRNRGKGKGKEGQRQSPLENFRNNLCTKCHFPAIIFRKKPHY